MGSERPGLRLDASATRLAAKRDLDAPATLMLERAASCCSLDNSELTAPSGWLAARVRASRRPARIAPALPAASMAVP